MGKSKVQRVNREVIEGKLLAALDDGGKVAILADEDDCRMILNALERYHGHLLNITDFERAAKCRDFADDLKRLGKETFGWEV